jgi:FtsZ-interacting cell division protein ZipA
MTTIVYIAIAIAVVALIVGFTMMTKRRNETKKDALRVEAGESRDLAAATRLEAARQGAIADERTAHAKSATLAAEQQRNDAAATLADATTLQQHADEIDPDVTTS